MTKHRERRKMILQESVRILVTVLGINADKAIYSLDGETFPANLAPVALCHLLPCAKRPNNAIAVCTEQSAQSFEQLRRQLPDIRIDQLVISSDGGEAGTFLQEMFDVIPRDRPVELILDVTHGFRHLSFLVFVGGLYISEVRKNVRVVGAYYGARKQGEELVPLVSLTQLFELSDWFSALREFQNVGSTRGLEKCLRSRGEDHQEQRKRIDHLKRVGIAYQSALPLELGKEAAQLLVLQKQIRRALADLPGGKELADELLAALGHFRLEGSYSGEGWKSKVPLVADELCRQAELVDALLDQSNYSGALGLMREWLVSWLMLGDESSLDVWLERRGVQERRLGAYSQLKGNVKESLSDPQGILDLWKLVRDLRNALQHSGMRRDDVLSKRFYQDVTKIRKLWRKLVHPRPLARPALKFPADVACLLVTAMGKTSGSLYSAIRSVNPDRVLVVTSQELVTVAKEAAMKAGMSPEHLAFVALRDAKAGIEEKDQVVDRHDLLLASSERIVHCLTGGSTLTNFVAAELAERAENLNVPVRRIGLVDRRTREQQERDPYQLGDVLELRPKPRNH